MRSQLAAVVAMATVVLIGFGVEGASALAAPAPDDLAAALVSAEEISERMGTPMQVISSESGTQPVTNPVTTPSNCEAVYAPGSAAGYQDSAFTELAVQTLRSSGAAATPNVVQAVAEFPDTKAAQTYFNEQAAVWKSCKGTALTAAYANGMVSEVKVGVVTAASLEVVATLFANPMRGSSGCERVLQAKNNYVVDVRLCDDDNPGGKGRSLRSQIVRNLS